ncbi:hypothetical protein VTH06DRAFT_2484 [Thermothelomyces fergusii]
MGEPVDASKIPSLSLLYKLRQLSPPPPGAAMLAATPSRSLNDRVGLFHGDITTLKLDAIVNAANRSLLGGGGVDGAIHRAAGPGLYDECRALDGCQTGSAKITNGYRLPAGKVIHAVGPVYNPLDHDKSERLLMGCYTRSLELAADYGCRTVAFSAISTGVYGYPSQDAAPVALSAIRRFLTGPKGNLLDKVVIVTFEMKDVEAYNKFIPLYFPPVDEDVAPGYEKDEARETEGKLTAEAEAHSDTGPARKKGNKKRTER